MGARTPSLADRLVTERRWEDVPYDDWGGDGVIDSRTLTVALDALPDDRVLAVDSGNFMGYPSMFLDVPDEQGFCFSQAFQSVGLGLATARGLTPAARGGGAATQTGGRCHLRRCRRAARSAGCRRGWR